MYVYRRLIGNDDFNIYAFMEFNNRQAAILDELLAKYSFLNHTIMPEQKLSYQLSVLGYTTEDGVTFKFDKTLFKNIYNGDINDISDLEVSDFDGYTRYEQYSYYLLEFEQLQDSEIRSSGSQTPFKLQQGSTCMQYVTEDFYVDQTTGVKLIGVYELNSYPYWPAIMLNSLVKLNINAQDWTPSSVQYSDTDGLVKMYGQQDETYTYSQAQGYDEYSKTFNVDILRSYFQIQREGVAVDTNKAELYQLGKFIGNEQNNYKEKTWCDQHGFSQEPYSTQQTRKYQYQHYQWTADEINPNVSELVIPVKEQYEFGDVSIECVSSGQHVIAELSNYYSTNENVQVGFKQMVDQLQAEVGQSGYGFLPNDSVVQLVQVSDIVSIRTVQAGDMAALESLYNTNTQFECNISGKIKKVFQIQQTGYQELTKGASAKFEFASPISNVIILRSPNSQQISQQFVNGTNSSSEAQQSGSQLVFDQDPRQELSFTITQHGNQQTSTTYIQDEKSGLFVAFIIKYNAQFTEPIQYNDGYQYKQYIRGTSFNQIDNDLFQQIITDDQLFLRQSDGFRVKQYSGTGYELSLKDFIVIKTFPLLDNSKFDFFERSYQTFRYYIYVPAFVFSEFKLSDLVEEAD